MDPIVVLLVVLIVLALVGSVAVSPLLLALVVILVLFAVLGRGRYFARQGVMVRCRGVCGRGDTVTSGVQLYDLFFGWARCR